MGYQNFFATRLGADIGAADATITLETAPSVTSGRLTLEARNATQREIIAYTGVAGNTVTGVTRGVGGTTAKSHTKTALVEMNVTSMDLQDILDAFASFATSANDWRSAVGTPVYSSSDGAGQWKVTFPSDLRNFVSRGMKVRLTRNTAPPVQSMSLVRASSMYATRASGSVTALAITTQATVEAWVYINTLPASNATIFSRWDGTNGIRCDISGTGEITIRSDNGGQERNMVSQRGIVAGKWYHIAAGLDATALSGMLAVNGVQWDATFNNTGASAATYGSVGAMQVGGANGTLLWDGYLSEVRVWNTVRTLAQVQANMGNNLTGAESGLVFLARGDGNYNDLTSNANNLTATNGATFAVGTTLNPINPFHLNEMFYVSDIPSYSAPNTTLTLYGGVSAGVLPSVGTLTALAYSGARAPFNFPTERDVFVQKIRPARTQNGLTGASYNSPLNFNIVVPIGEFEVRGKLGFQLTGGEFSFGLSTSNNSVAGAALTDTFGRWHPATSALQLFDWNIPTARFTATALTQIFFIGLASGATQWDLRGDIASPQESYLEIEPTWS